MGAINVPSSPHDSDIPVQAKGNPVYEQTRQDMPLWCCGRNCGRNSRITVFVLGVFGIMCSSFVCLSPNYFSFVSLRNDTFYDPEKQQPKPFEYAVEANVGLFRYEILEVFEYPWPPKGQREMFDQLHMRELERLEAIEETFITSVESDLVDRNLQPNKFPEEFYDDDDTSFDPSMNSTNPNDSLEIELTRSPSYSPPGDLEEMPVPPVLPGSNKISRLPTSTPTAAPTRQNPNELIDVEIGVTKPYPPGSGLDKLFRNGQKGALWAPILASIGLIFCGVEYYCCVYKCSWLPTALFLYGAFMLQLMTLFMFMGREQFCGYSQDCELGSGGFLSILAVIAYLICQTLVCLTPRPPPVFDFLKKPPTRRKKKKKKRRNEWDDDESSNNRSDAYSDEPNSTDAYVGRNQYQGGHDSFYSDSYTEGGNDHSSGGYYDDYSSSYDTSNGGYDGNDSYRYGDQGSEGYGDDQPYGNYEYTGYEDESTYAEASKSSRKEKKGKRAKKKKSKGGL